MIPNIETLDSSIYRYLGPLKGTLKPYTSKETLGSTLHVLSTLCALRFRVHLLRNAPPQNPIPKGPSCPDLIMVVGTCKTPEPCNIKYFDT